MKKLPTLFQREFDGHRVVNILPQLTTLELEWVLKGEGVATEKIDGACCAIIGGNFYKRYDAKRNKQGIMKIPPASAIPCDEPDPVTGHWPHWKEFYSESDWETDDPWIKGELVQRQAELYEKGEAKS